MFTKKLIIAAAVVMSLVSIPSNAQMNQRLIEAQKENARALRQFEWKSRSEILKDGESKKTQVEQVRYDANGELEKTIIASSPEPDLPSHGLRGHIAKKKKKEFLEKVEKLTALAKTYSNLPPEVMQRFMATATFTSGNQNLIRIEGRNVMQAGDSMVIFVDGVLRKQRRIEINSALDDKPVSIVSEFRDLGPNGPTYMARSDVTYNRGDVVLITENFDHTPIHR
jgi:hypothetical protein